MYRLRIKKCEHVTDMALELLSYVGQDSLHQGVVIVRDVQKSIFSIQHLVQQ